MYGLKKFRNQLLPRIGPRASNDIISPHMFVIFFFACRILLLLIIKDHNGREDVSFKRRCNKGPSTSSEIRSSARVFQARRSMKGKSH